MNNPNPFLPQGAFLEQKNKARTRLKIAVFFSISLSVIVLMGLLIQGCKKPNDTIETDTTTTSSTDTNLSSSSLPTNPPDLGMLSNTPPPPETNPPVYTPPAPPPAPPAPPIATTEEYTIVPGDYLAKIAKHYPGVSVKAIMDANPGIDPKKLKIGQKIHIPSATSTSATSAPTMSGMTSDATATGGMQTYKVKSGDTLDGIHRKFHVSIKAIQSANNLTTTSIKVGQVLKIPGAAAPAPAPTESLPPPSLSAPAPAPTGAPAPTTLPPPTGPAGR